MTIYLRAVFNNMTILPGPDQQTGVWLLATYSGAPDNIYNRWQISNPWHVPGTPSSV